MQTAETGYDLVLDPAAYAGIHLVAEDGIPMESIWHVYCMWLLIEVTVFSWRDRPDYWVGGNNFIYFNPDQARNRDYRGPDYYFIKNGVDRSRERDYWAIWQENGRRPDTIIELLSPTTEREDRTTKFTIYEQTLRVPEYFLYDRNTERLEGWRLIGSSYAQLTADERGWMWSEELGLWLGTWVGEYLTVHATWLRMYTANGDLVPTFKELANAAEQHIDRERQAREQAEQHSRVAQEAREQAEQHSRVAQEAREQAEQELARLRALLQQQPPKTNGTGS